MEGCDTPIVMPRRFFVLGRKIGKFRHRRKKKVCRQAGKRAEDKPPGRPNPTHIPFSTALNKSVCDRYVRCRGPPLKHLIPHFQMIRRKQYVFQKGQPR